MSHVTLGILAHVDAGKTTLSEGLLYAGGAIRQMGRVDHGDTFFDTDEIERSRGITIFSKQTEISFGSLSVTLLDTPGHVDFSAETERTLSVLDYAILVVSGTAGVQSHTRRLWQLLSSHQVPTILFVNKMDIAKGTPEALLSELREALSPEAFSFDGLFSAEGAFSRRRNGMRMWPPHQRCFWMFIWKKARFQRHFFQRKSAAAASFRCSTARR